MLAGSIRDDGPLPDTMMNLVEAQDRYTEALQGVKLVLVLSTMLHGIGVGNMLPAWVRLVCVDINPAVVTKLADRGSSQTIGIVTDVGLVPAAAGIRSRVDGTSNGERRTSNDMEKPMRMLLMAMSGVALAAGLLAAQQAPVGYDDTPMQPNGRWRIHDGSRPQPKVVTPGAMNRSRRRRMPPCWSARAQIAARGR